MTFERFSLDEASRWRHSIRLGEFWFLARFACFVPVLAVGLPLLILQASCTDGGAASEAGSNPAAGSVSSVPPGSPANPPASTSGGTSSSSSGDRPPPTPPTAGSSCARDVVARTAPVRLFDAFKADLPALSGAARTARVEKLLADAAAQGGLPFEDPTSGRVVFLARGDGPSGPWKVSGTFNGWQPNLSLSPIVDTDLSIAEATIPRTGGSFEYKLVSGTASYLEDPLAKNVVWDGIDRGFGVKGEMNAIGHPGNLPMDKGRMVSLGKVHATKLNDDRDVWVYYPSAYDNAASCPKLPSIIFHDGLESLTRGAFAKVADTLYASKPALAAVLVFVGLPNQNVRMEQYTFASDGAKGADYVDFLASDLAAALKPARLCTKPNARGISGASLGGLISTYAAFEKPDQWGWVGAQSASFFWANNAMITRAESDAKKPLRIYLDSGCPDDNCVVTDQMDTTLTTKGYDHVRIKQNGASHDWPFWRDRLAGVLTHFRENQTTCD